MNDLPNPWPAPRADQPVDADIRLPGSKSLTNRALVLAALVDAPSRISRPLRARDTLLMAGGLRALGVRVTDDRVDWVVSPSGLVGGSTVDVGNAGTVMRFLPPIACLAKGSTRFDGDRRAYERPLRPLLDALRALGADINDGGRGGLPMTVHGTGGLTGGTVELDASRSSQFVSALLLAGARYESGLTVRHVGPPVPSAPHLAMTVDVLRAAGAVVDDSVANVWRILPGRLRAHDVVIEPDLSNAAPFLAAALVTGGRVTIGDWPAHTRQPGAALPALLGALGGEIDIDQTGLTARGSGRIAGVDLDLRDVSELVPVLVALTALADSPSRLRGIAHMRAHETDRLAALARELNALGGCVGETPDGLIVQPRPLSGGLFRTYDDHRLAMAAAVLGLVVPDLAIENVATTGKTLPDFPDRWLAMLGGRR